MVFGKKVKLDEVSIAAPCPMNWDAMEGDNRVRFCSLCQLNVYNISEMPRREAEKLIESQNDQLCLRLYRRHDGTLITADCPVGRRMIDFAKKRLRAIAAAMIAIMNAPAVFGQQQNHKVDAETGRVEGPRDTNLFIQNTKIIEGRHYRSNPTEPRKDDNPKLPLTKPPISQEGVPAQHSALQAQDKQNKNNADRAALQAFLAAQAFEQRKEADKATESYEDAIRALRSSKLKHDQKFASEVAAKYAKFLCKQRNFLKAASIAKEFRNTK